MGAEATRRAASRMSRFRAWRGSLRPRGPIGGNSLAMSAGHAAVLILGLLVVVVGAWEILSTQIASVPTISVLVVGVILVFLGVAETLVEAETDRTRRHKD